MKQHSQENGISVNWSSGLRDIKNVTLAPHPAVPLKMPWLGHLAWLKRVILLHAYGFWPCEHQLLLV